MKMFEYNFSIPANSQAEADEKMKALAAIVPKLSLADLQAVKEVVSNPAKLAMMKLRLG